MDRHVFIRSQFFPRFLILGFVFAGVFHAFALAQAPNTKPLSTAEHIQKAIELLDSLDNPTESQDTKAIFDEINQHVIAVQTAEPANPWIYYLLGRSYAARGRSGDAIDQLRRFVETREGRNEWKAYCLLGDQCVGEFPNLAKPNYDKAAALKNNEPLILMGLSRCAQKMGDLDGALNLAKAAVEADGHKKAIYVANLAKMYSAKKQWADAESAGQEAYKIADADARRHPRLRPVLETLDSEAQLLIDILRPRMGESGWNAEDAVRLVGYMRHRADTSRRLSLYDAFQVLEKAIKQFPDAPQKLLDEYNDVTRELDAAAASS